MTNILEVKNLQTYFFLNEGILKAVNGVSYSINEKQTLGIIGESGCGKSVTAQSILRIIPKSGLIKNGEILLHTKLNNTNITNDNKSLTKTIDLVKLDEKGAQIRSIRGNLISMIFQEPMTSLSPVHTIGDQIIESIMIHDSKNKKEAKEIALDMLNRVKISNPSQRIDEYPYLLSGGMRQRAMIAMALCCKPILLIADEPTTALDVTVQAQILDLLMELQYELGMAIQYITHDLGVISEISDYVAVMYLGRIVEYGSVKKVFKNPMHPYTQGLLKSLPKLGKKNKTKLNAISGNVPIPINLPEQCVFYSRCSFSNDIECKFENPNLEEIEKDHSVSCFLNK